MTAQTGLVIGGMAMSLDGFINDAQGSLAPLYPDLEALGNTAELRELIRSTGAVVMGRRAYDLAQGDFTHYEFQTPIFVLTHHAPAQLPRGDNPRLSFTYVSDGITSAITQAKAAAGSQHVVIIGGASTLRQALQAGLVDELHMDIVPILLGGGTRPFEGLDPVPIELESSRLIESPRMAHLRFRVQK